MLAILGILAVAVLMLVVAPLAVGFGATSSDREGPIPGDGIIGLPWGGYTQAVKIQAPAEEVWKWLVQVGYKRAGWYNIDAINRLAAEDFFIDGKGSSWRIVPELQDLQTVIQQPAMFAGIQTRAERAWRGKETQ